MSTPAPCGRQLVFVDRSHVDQLASLVLVHVDPPAGSVGRRGRPGLVRVGQRRRCRLERVHLVVWESDVNAGGVGVVSPALQLPQRRAAASR
jgi:hypothetical protein